MNNVKISIIVAAYNVAEWLPRCVKSVIAQTHTNWELILIDDGSKDETGKIADSFAEQDSRIIVVHQKNTGLVSVREKGISMASGEYIGFVDGDDAVDHNMYEKLLSNALAHNADISHCSLRVCYNGQDDKGNNGTGNILIQSKIEASRDLLEGEWMTPSLCNKLYKRQLLNDSCLNKDITNNEDLLRNYVLFGRANKVVFEDFQGYQYWSRENSMSNDTKILQRNQQVIKARQIILDHASKEVFPHAVRLLLSTYVGVINQNYQSGDASIQEMCKKCRIELRKNKKYISLLIRRQQIAAYLILYAPWLHHLIYRIYDSRR